MAEAGDEPVSAPAPASSPSRSSVCGDGRDAGGPRVQAPDEPERPVVDRAPGDARRSSLPDLSAPGFDFDEAILVLGGGPRDTCGGVPSRLATLAEEVLFSSSIVEPLMSEFRWRQTATAFAYKGERERGGWAAPPPGCQTGLPCLAAYGTRRSHAARCAAADIISGLQSHAQRFRRAVVAVLAAQKVYVQRALEFDHSRARRRGGRPGSARLTWQGSRL